MFLALNPVIVGSLAAWPKLSEVPGLAGTEISFGAVKLFTLGDA